VGGTRAQPSLGTPRGSVPISATYAGEGWPCHIFSRARMRAGTSRPRSENGPLILNRDEDGNVVGRKNRKIATVDDD